MDVTRHLRTVVHAAVDTSWPAIEAAGHQLVVDLPDQPVHVTGDAVRLAQVFGNLLTNAAKYTEGPGRLRVAMRTTPDGVCVSVIDNGIGIAADQLSSVFDMFTQVDRSSRRAQGGLGIGLTLVRSLVSMHDGRVEALSGGLDQGSEFRVHLPVAPGPLPLAGGTDGHPPLPPQRLLIVDDNRDAAEMLGQLLSSLGATVRTADSGPAALEALGEFAPDAVLLDIGMPGMDGYEVARRMRATPRGGDLVLIALTGWGQEHDQQRALAAGFDHHVVKPAEVGVLRELLAIAPRR